MSGYLDRINEANDIKKIEPDVYKRQESMTQGVGMLLQVLIGCVLMFILSLAVVCNAASVIDI